MTQQQIVAGILLLVLICAAVAVLSWELAVGRYRKQAKKRDAAIKTQQERYAEILQKLNEDPQAYAMGVGVSYVVRTMRATLDAIEADLEKPT